VETLAFGTAAMKWGSSKWRECSGQ